ncbi:class I SAM-dependent methyltransferase [Candidatus Shapirobacteria bacterium]|nr:class I SAM-dependent methyltransferase [Candidatus Shapirobacteria bacterium]
MGDTRFSDQEYIEYLDKSRTSFFWNEDQLGLIFKNIDTGVIHNFLDAGCGLGYFTFLAARFLNKQCDLLGIDIDPKLIKIARRNINKYNFSNVSFEVGDIYNLKAPKGSFDFIAEQLTLLHLEKPEEAIKELLRVLKPGGSLLVIEPNNLAMSVVYNNVTDNLSIEEKIALLSFEMRVQQGKIKAGEGDDNYGDRILELLVKHDMKILDIRLCDKLSPVYPPYDSFEKKRLIKSVRNEHSLYWEKLFKRYYIAAGGLSKEFDKIWKFKKKINKQIERAIINDNYYDIGAGLLYSYLFKKTK